jgi:hypothetical protein
MSVKLRDPLPEASLRVLRHIADQMRAGYTGRLEIDLKDGGVAGFREIRSMRPADMPESDDWSVRFAS